MHLEWPRLGLGMMQTVQLRSDTTRVQCLYSEELRVVWLEFLENVRFVADPALQVCRRADV
jgi:hypothetical protein